jgi:hypothetical protein
MCLKILQLLLIILYIIYQKGIIVLYPDTPGYFAWHITARISQTNDHPISNTWRQLLCKQTNTATSTTRIVETHRSREKRWPRQPSVQVYRRPCSLPPVNGHYGRLHRSTETIKERLKWNDDARRVVLLLRNLGVLGSKLSSYTKCPDKILAIPLPLLVNIETRTVPAAFRHILCTPTIRYYSDCYRNTRSTVLVLTE